MTKLKVLHTTVFCDMYSVVSVFHGVSHEPENVTDVMIQFKQTKNVHMQTVSTPTASRLSVRQTMPWFYHRNSQVRFLAEIINPGIKAR